MPRLEDYLIPGTRLSLPNQPRRTITPDEQSTLDYLGETSLGGLAYLGKLADKTFGARAVRGGILGGKPNELLSILPLSDTLGITDERDIVYGKELLEKSGFLTPDPTPGFGWNDVAGIGLDIALDPATYLGFGTLTRAGQLAQKAGARLPGGTASRIAGYGAREADLAAHGNPYQVAKGLGIRQDEVLDNATDQLLRSAGLAPETRFVSAGGHLAPNPNAATPLAGALGIGLPFSQRSAILTGPVGEMLAKYNPIRAATLPLRLADRGIDATTGFSPGRALRALFDPTVKGMHSVHGQELGEFTTRGEDQLRRAAMGEFADQFQLLDDIMGAANVDRARTGWQYARAAIEGAQPQRIGPWLPTPPKIDPNLAASAAIHFQPNELADIERIGSELAASVAARRSATAAKGVESPTLTDPMIEYFLRSQQVMPRQPGEKLWSYLTRFNEQYGARHASQIAREEIFKGIPFGTTRLNQWSMDPALSGVARTQTPLQVQNQIAQEILAGSPLIVNPQSVMTQAGHLSDWLGRLPAAHAQKQVPFFSEDLMSDFLKYAKRDAKASSAADTTYEAIARFSEPITPGAANADSLVPLDKVMREMGLTGRDALGQPIAPLLAAGRLRISPNDLSRHGIPAELYRDMRRLNEAWQNPREMIPVLAAVDAVATLFKTHVTAAFPAFHMRNIVSSVFNMWRSGEGPMGAIDPQAMGQAMSFVRGNGIHAPLPGMRGANAQEWTKELTSELIAGELAFTPRYTNTSDIVGQAGEQIVRRPNLPRSTGKSFAGDAADWAGGLVPKRIEQINPLNVQGVLRDTDVFTPVAQMRKFGQMGEDWGIVSHYMALRKQGWAPEAASREVKKFQGHNALTNFDEQFMKRIAPWWRFQKNNLPPILEQFAKDPAKLSATLRGISQGREPFEFIPSYVAESASLPLPGAPEGQQRYVTSFGLPLEDEGIRLLGSLSRGDFTRAGQSALGMSMPYFKTPMELLFGTQLHSGRRLQDLRPSESVSLGGLLPEEFARKATQVIASSPAGRTLSSIDKILDERKGIPEKAINLLSGVRISDVDIEGQRDFARKRLLEDLLSGQPGVRRSDAVYLSRRAQQEGRVSPEEQALFDLYMKLDSKIKRQSR